MTNYRDAVGSSSHIEFKAIAALLEAAFKGLQGILRDMTGGAGAAMAEE